MSHTIKLGCNHYHVTSRLLRAYAPICVPVTWKRRFWRWTKTTQFFCAQCGESMRHKDKRYYT